MDPWTREPTKGYRNKANSSDQYIQPSNHPALIVKYRQAGGGYIEVTKGRGGLKDGTKLI